MKIVNIPQVTLVGAGPGDPDLITVKGLNAIKNANAVLYDALSSIELLNFTKRECKKIYVGKRKGCISNKQETINQLIVHCAKKYGNIVRLKGGDPFVFGRGYEEIAYARLHGVDTKVIPGISSSIAAPQSIGIPITHRGTSESFWVTTGMLQNGSLSTDIALVAKSSATVVILMGLSKINEIVEIFIDAGKRDIPMAIIENATNGDQKSIIATVGTMLNQLSLYAINTPATIVIGEVVGLSNASGCNHFEALKHSINHIIER